MNSVLHNVAPLPGRCCADWLQMMQSASCNQRNELVAHLRFMSMLTAPEKVDQVSLLASIVPFNIFTVVLPEFSIQMLYTFFQATLISVFDNGLWCEPYLHSFTFQTLK